MRKSYIQSSIGLALIQGMNLVVPVLLIPIIASVQGLEAYGEYATVLAYYYFGALVCDYGFDFSSVRELKRTENRPADRHKIVQGTFSAKWLLFLVAYPVSALCLYFFGGVHDIALLASGLLIPATSVVSVHWLYLADARLAQLVVPIGIARVLSLLAVVLIYPTWPSLWLVVMLTVAPVLAVQIALWLGIQKQLPDGPWFSLGEALRAIRSGTAAFHISFLSSYMATTALVAASIVAPARDVGVLAAVERIAKAAFGVAKPFLSTLYPEMSAMYLASRSRWTAMVMRVATIGIAVGGSCALAIYLWWEPIAMLAFGHPVPESKKLAYGFAAWLTTGIVNNALGIQGLIASGNDQTYGRGALVAACVLTVGYVVLGNEHGTFGIVLAMLIAEMTLLLLNARAFVALNRRDAS
jgi:PST family polysaccharide transporter